MNRVLLPVLAVIALVGCDSQQPPPTQGPSHAPEQPAKPAINGPDAGALLENAKQAFQPLPAFMLRGQEAKPSTAMIDLGRVLYYDARFSKNQQISCNSCHDLARDGVDGQPTSPGHKGIRGVRNSPTVFNAALHSTQFWDGREPDVEAQAKGPVLNPVEMALPDAAAVDTVLKSIPGYADLFKAAFPDQADPVNFDNMATAIGGFERGLVTPGPWDAFLGGDLTALNQQQLKGLETYMSVGCTTCHAGPAMGGMGFFKLGQVKPVELKDEGRLSATHDEADKFFFKPPGLRNITKTGPYYHDGSMTSLDQAVKHMAEHQLGKTLTDTQVNEIIAFLDALTGTVDAEYVKQPTLPESGPDTPKADLE